MIDLVLGGNKSGKSDFALGLLASSPKPWTFVATGKARDMAFREQIRIHRQERDPEITVVEVDTELPETLASLSGRAGGILVDSLDFWLFSVNCAFTDAAARGAARSKLMAELTAWKGGRLILVSTEMGLGPLAFDGETRAFVRDLGGLNREIARVGTSVYLLVAGLPQKLK